MNVSGKGRAGHWRWLGGLLVLLLVLQGCGSAGQESTTENENSASFEGSASDHAESVFVTADGGFEGEEEVVATVQDQSGASEAPEEVSTSRSLAAETISGSSTADFSRKIMYTANVDMTVEDYEAARRKIGNLVGQWNGYILKFTENSGEENRSGSLTVKIPAGDFMTFLNQLEQIEHLDASRHVQGDDVTEEYVDLASRLKAKELVEERLLQFMERAETSEALLEFSRELARVQEEIEQIKGRMRYIDQRVDYATAHIRLHEKRMEAQKLEVGNQDLGKRLSEAFLMSTNGILVFFRELLVLLVGAIPVLILLSVVVLPIFLGIRKSRQRSKTSNPE